MPNLFARSMRRKEELEEEGTENEVERNNATTKGGVRADKMEKFFIQILFGEHIKQRILLRILLRILTQ